MDPDDPPDSSSILKLPRRHEAAPKFDGQPLSLLRYLEEIYVLGKVSHYSDSEIIEAAIFYIPDEDYELWSQLPEASGDSWEAFKTAVVELYPGADGDRKYSFRDLEDLIEKSSSEPANNIDQFGTFYRDFIRVSSFLKRKSRLTDHEAAKFFLLGLHIDFRKSVRERLRLKNPDHHPDDPWTLKEVADAAIFVISPYTVHEVKSPSPSQEPNLSNKVRSRSQDPEPRDTHQTPSFEPRTTEKPDYALSTPEREVSSRTFGKVSVPEESMDGLGTSYIDLAENCRTGVTYANAPCAQSATTASKDVISTHHETQDPNAFADPPSLEFPRCPRPRSFETVVAAVQSESYEEEKDSHEEQTPVNVKDRVQENCSLKIKPEPHKPRVLKIEFCFAVLQIQRILEFLCHFAPIDNRVIHDTSDDTRLPLTKHGPRQEDMKFSLACPKALECDPSLLLTLGRKFVETAPDRSSKGQIKFSPTLFQSNYTPQVACLPRSQPNIQGVHNDPSCSIDEMTFGFDKDNPTSTSSHLEISTALWKIVLEVNLRKSLGDGDPNHFKFPPGIDLESQNRCQVSILSTSFSIYSEKLSLILTSLLRAYLLEEDKVFKNSSVIKLLPPVVKTSSSSVLHFQHRSRHG
ncbi:hypothetical protein CVT26_000375, partial [Gymnopilus dilepis]